MWKTIIDFEISFIKNLANCMMQKKLNVKDTIIFKESSNQIECPNLCKNISAKHFLKKIRCFLKDGNHGNGRF